MTRKLTLGTIVTAVLAIGVLGSIGLGLNASNANEISSQNGYFVTHVAFAEKPTQEIITIDVSGSDYGSLSSFDIDTVECKISTKGSETKLNWCKATAIQDKTVFEATLSALFGLVGGEDDGSDLWAFLTAVLGDPENYAQYAIEYETDQLSDTLDGILASEYPGIIIPEVYKKSVELEMSIENGGSAQTKAVVGIEYI